MLQSFMFLGNWRNYSDRIIKKSPATQSEMLNAVENWQYKKHIPNVNFDIADGIDSSVVVEWTEQWTPNYVWITGNTDAESEVQGWFVMEFEQTRGQQFKAVLHRDVIADNYDKVLNATSFIEKANLSPDDPLIFNNEGMTFNQIKKEEKLLKDRTGVSWIVGYLASNTNAPKDLEYSSTYLDVPYTAAKIVAEDSSFNYSQTAVNVADLSFADIINYSTDTNKTFRNITNMEVGVQTRREDLFSYYLLSYVLNFTKENSKPARNEFISAYTNYSNNFILDSEDYRRNQESILDTYRAGGAYPIKEYLLEPGMNDIYNSLSVDEYVSLRRDMLRFVNGNPGFRTDLLTILSYNNRIIKSGDKYYKLKVSETPSGLGTKTVRGNGWLTSSILKPFLSRAFTTLSTNLGNSVNGISRNNVNAITPNSYLIGVRYKEYRVDAIEITSTTLNTLITNAYIQKNEAVNSITRNKLSDSPYDMFAIPYVDENGNGITLQSSLRVETKFTSSADVSLRIAQAIARDFGDACYDLQIVPYCPIPEIEPGMIMGAKLRNHKDYVLVRLGDTPESGDVVGAVFFPNTSKGTLDIVSPIDGGSSAIEKKIINECETYKLCSPNFSGEFEFSPAKNNGVEYFNVDYLYRPFSPYIHVNPNFGGLYGKDFNDARGLICGGSFSAGSVKSAWTNYELNNKNYAEIFDRQIHSLDVNNSIAMTQQRLSAGIGVIQGGMSGMITGAMVGGGLGAAAGSIIGTGSSLTGGIVDTQLLARQQKEQKSYQIDMYGYNLGNIKAIPYSLSSVSSLTNNNKLFPFVERYSCTDEEKEIFRLKLKYDGMTVMRIGQIKDYILTDDNFIRATLVRSTDISEDNHMIETIYSELRKGVYL